MELTFNTSNYDIHEVDALAHGNKLEWNTPPLEGVTTAQWNTMRKIVWNGDMSGVNVRLAEEKLGDVPGPLCGQVVAYFWDALHIDRHVEKLIIHTDGAFVEPELDSGTWNDTGDAITYIVEECDVEKVETKIHGTFTGRLESESNEDFGDECLLDNEQYINGMTVAQLSKISMLGIETTAAHYLDLTSIDGETVRVTFYDREGKTTGEYDVKASGEYMKAIKPNGE